MGEEDKRNMAEPGGMYLPEIQSEGMSYKTTVWKRCKVQMWQSSGRLCCKDTGQLLSSGLKVRCGSTTEIPDRKQEMTSAATQQLCQGDRGRRKEGAKQGGRGLHLSSINTIVLSPKSNLFFWVTFPPWFPKRDALMPGTEVERKLLDLLTIQSKFWLLYD